MLVASRSRVTLDAAERQLEDTVQLGDQYCHGTSTVKRRIFLANHIQVVFEKAQIVNTSVKTGGNLGDTVNFE